MKISGNKILAAVMLSSLSFAFPSAVLAATQLTEAEIQLNLKRKFKTYVPQKYELFEVVEGDLNKDGRKDAVLIVKGTDTEQWVTDEYRGRLDRNRRGIVVLLASDKGYTQLMQNLSCFSSENEDGGVYFPPELVPSIEKGVLHIHYAHGRYGYWRYTFRIQAKDMRLIGYDDSSNHGPYVSSETSVNFLTGKKLKRKNINEDWDGDPVFREHWSKVSQPQVLLSAIQDFDELDVINDR